MITSLELFAISNICVVATETFIFPPPASSMISPATSTVKSPLDKSISVPSIVMLSTTTPAFEVVHLSLLKCQIQ